MEPGRIFKDRRDLNDGKGLIQSEKPKINKGV